MCCVVLLNASQDGALTWFSSQYDKISWRERMHIISRQFEVEAHTRKFAKKKKFAVRQLKIEKRQQRTRNKWTSSSLFFLIILLLRKFCEWISMVYYKLWIIISCVLLHILCIFNGFSFCWFLLNKNCFVFFFRFTLF